jgi:cysteine desulfurase
MRLLWVILILNKIEEELQNKLYKTQIMIYLDNNATTKIDPRVLDAMMPYLTDNFANAASTHKFGVAVNDAVSLARKSISNLIGCETNEVFFTSGSTEAINLLLKGVFSGTKERKEIITLHTEHSAVIDTCSALEKEGAKITFIPVNSNGLVDLEKIKEAVSQNTLLVCVMYVNNETGVIQPIKEISEIAHNAGAYFMTDATQAVGRIPCKVDELGIDMLCFSGHKFYGPKGIGGAFIRQRRPFRVKINPLLHGGGHEKGIRSGTLNVPGIVGLGKAAEISDKEMKKDEERIKELRDYLESSLLQIEGTSINGTSEHRIYNTANIRFNGIDSDALIMGLDDIAVSNGSACTANSIEPSHVLTAMGQNDEEAFSAIRFSLGRYTTLKDIERTKVEVNKAVLTLRTMTQI